jgi:hypothetical protein
VLDSDSACSQISFKYFEQLGIDGLGPKLEPMQVNFVSVSGQGLAIVGQVHAKGRNTWFFLTLGVFGQQEAGKAAYLGGRFYC